MFVLLAAALGAADARGAQEPDAPRAPISSAAQLFTCCTPAAFQDRMFAEAKAGGAEFVRVDIELNGIFEAEGSRDHPDWRAFDAMLARAESHGVRVLGLLRGSPTWLSDCPELGTKAPLCAPKDPAEFGRLAGEVAARARGRIDHWEILNEPDARWAFTGTPEQYARMLSASYDAIKARAPSAQVVFGGVERPDRRGWIDRVLATDGADAATKFDVANVHLRLRAGDLLPDLGEQLNGWRALLADHGFDGPIWVTEHGYPADPVFQRDPAFRGAATNPLAGERAQAAFLAESIPRLAEAGADQIFVTLRDGAFGEFLVEGLVHVDERRPDYPAARRLAFATVSGLARGFDESGPARSRRHAEEGEALRRLANESLAAGRPVAAALQEGAAEAHAALALELGR